MGNHDQVFVQEAVLFPVEESRVEDIRLNVTYSFGPHVVQCWLRLDAVDGSTGLLLDRRSNERGGKSRTVSGPGMITSQHKIECSDQQESER
jgi:hypothetical protein